MSTVCTPSLYAQAHLELVARSAHLAQDVLAVEALIDDAFIKKATMLRVTRTTPIRIDFVRTYAQENFARELIEQLKALWRIVYGAIQKLWQRIVDFIRVEVIHLYTLNKRKLEALKHRVATSTPAQYRDKPYETTRLIATFPTTSSVAYDAVLTRVNAHIKESFALYDLNTVRAIIDSVAFKAAHATKDYYREDAHQPIPIDSIEESLNALYTHIAILLGCTTDRVQSAKNFTGVSQYVLHGDRRAVYEAHFSEVDADALLGWRTPSNQVSTQVIEPFSNTVHLQELLKSLNELNELNAGILKPFRELNAMMTQTNTHVQKSFDALASVTDETFESTATQYRLYLTLCSKTLTGLLEYVKSLTVYNSAMVRSGCFYVESLFTNP